MAVSLLGCALIIAAVLLAGSSGQQQPRVTAIAEELADDELFHRLRQFHGHLGPYAVLGYRLGSWLLHRLGCGKYFGAHITVTGAGTTPYTCLLDGLQVSTGHTLGKRNLTLNIAADCGGDTLFQIEAIAEADGELLRVEVPLTVTELFAEWMDQELTEEEIFDRTLSWPQEELWQEVR